MPDPDRTARQSLDAFNHYGSPAREYFEQLYATSPTVGAEDKFDATSPTVGRHDPFLIRQESEGREGPPPIPPPTDPRTVSDKNPHAVPRPDRPRQESDTRAAQSATSERRPPPISTQPDPWEDPAWGQNPRTPPRPPVDAQGRAVLSTVPAATARPTGPGSAGNKNLGWNTSRFAKPKPKR
jgi:hypothetical protein